TLMESAMNTSPSVSTPGLSASVSGNKRNATLAGIAEVTGRFLLALLFLLSGLGKLGAYGSTAAYMSATGVPGALLPVVIATEVLGGLAILLGWKTRVVAFLLAGFSLLTAVTFHNKLADQTQMIMFFKNLSIAGGFLLLVANGAGSLSLDRRSVNKGSL
ncbi:MAG: DoxX family protein, partial [Ktedonobacterales bacterium]